LLVFGVDDPLTGSRESVGAVAGVDGSATFVTTAGEEAVGLAVEVALEVAGLVVAGAEAAGELEAPPAGGLTLTPH
jgi:hypothetical protein